MVNQLWGSQQTAFRWELRRARKRVGLTQVQLSKELAKHQSFVSKYETGERRLDFLEVKAICSRCKMTIAEFDDSLTQSTTELTTNPHWLSMENSIRDALEYSPNSSVAMRAESTFADAVLSKKAGKIENPRRKRP